MEDGDKIVTLDDDEPMSKFLNAIIASHQDVCADLKISPMQYCIVMANVQGIILSNYRDMPRDVALGRMDDLRTLVQMAYDTADVEGKG